MKFGNIETLESGKVRARYGHRGVRHAKTLANEQEAIAYLNQKQGQILQNSHVTPTKRTFTDVANEMLDEHVDVRAGTKAGYRNILNSVLIPYFDKRQLADIDVTDWRAFVREAEKTHKSGTVRNYRAVMNLVYEYAIAQRYIGTDKNPCPFVKIRKPEREEAVFLSLEQAMGLAGGANKQGSLAIRTMAYCGLRAGELWDLKVKNLMLDKGRLQVVSSVREVPGVGLVSTPAPKTGPWRAVSLPPQIVRDLREQIAGKGPEDYVFTTVEGAQVRHSNWRRDVWAKALEYAELPVTPRVHDLRHTCAALYFDNGRTAEEVRRVLGHTSIQTTTKHYAHIWPEAFDRMVDGIGDIIAMAEIAHDLRQMTSSEG